jgi:inner membrane protein
MNGRTHLIGGLLAGLVVASVVQTAPETKAIGVLLAGAAGLTPDRIQYTIRHARLPLEGHRGVSHTLLFLIVTTLIFRAELAPYWAVGLASHLLLDVITVSGVPLFYPLYRRRVSLSLTTNGGRVEFVLRAVLLVSSGLLLYRLL